MSIMFILFLIHRMSDAREKKGEEKQRKRKMHFSSMTQHGPHVDNEFSQLHARSRPKTVICFFSDVHKRKLEVDLHRCLTETGLISRESRQSPGLFF